MVAVTEVTAVTVVDHCGYCDSTSRTGAGPAWPLALPRRRRRPSRPGRPAPARVGSGAPVRRGPLRRLLGRQSEDVWGLAVLVLAVLCALGIYSHLAGPVGRALDHGTADGLGWIRVLVPPVIAYVGWVHDPRARPAPTGAAPGRARR